MTGGVAEPASAAVLMEWSRRVVAEYRSAAVTAQIAHWMIQAALPEDLIEAALRIVGDELAHARLCHGCLCELGGAPTPAALNPNELAEPAPDGVLPALVDSVVKNFCVGETLAVPLFDVMRRQSSHPAVEPVLLRVVRDEAVHRAFGWDALDALIAVHGEGVRARVRASLPEVLSAFRAAYAAEGAVGGVWSDAERAAGLLDLAQYRSVFWDTVRGDLRRRFARREITVSAEFGGDVGAGGG